MSKKSKAKINTPNGAMATMLQTQAMFVALQTAIVAQQTAFLTRQIEIQRRLLELKSESDKRYAEIQSVLAEHTRLLKLLPEAVQARMNLLSRPSMS